MTAHSHSNESTWSGHALSELSEAGFRNGASRRRVVELLGTQSCAITALDLDGQLDGVGRATVYRALDQMEDLGLIQKIDMGGDSAGYEKVDPEGHHHHHIVCTSCGKVVPFEDPRLERVIHEVSERDGFSIQSHDVTLRGICDACS